MTEQNSITPPPKLVEQWMQDHSTKYDLARHAAQWGADQELEACCEWLVSEGWFRYEHEAVQDLRAARRPQPSNLKLQALAALYAVVTGANDTREQRQDLDTIRRALEALDD